MKSLCFKIASGMAVAHKIVYTFLLLLSAFCFVSSKEKKCEKIKIPMCQSIGYNLTYMPNMFNHDTQEEAALEVHQFWPLVTAKSDVRLISNSSCVLCMLPCASRTSKTRFPHADRSVKERGQAASLSCSSTAFRGPNE